MYITFHTQIYPEIGPKKCGLENEGLVRHMRQGRRERAVDRPQNCSSHDSPVIRHHPRSELAGRKIFCLAD